MEYLNLNCISVLSRKYCFWFKIVRSSLTLIALQVFFLPFFRTDLYCKHDLNRWNPTEFQLWAFIHQTRSLIISQWSWVILILMNFYETTRTTIRNKTTNCSEYKHPKTTKSQSTMSHLPISGERKTLCSWIFTICIVTAYWIMLYYDIQSFSEIEHNAALTYPVPVHDVVPAASSVPTNDWIAVQWDLPIESWTGHDDAIWEHESPGMRSLLGDAVSDASAPRLSFAEQYCTGQILYDRLQYHDTQYIRKIEFTIAERSNERITLNFDGSDFPLHRTFVGGSIQSTDGVRFEISSFQRDPSNHQIVFRYSKEKSHGPKEILDLLMKTKIEDVYIYRGAASAPLWTGQRLVDVMNQTSKFNITAIKFTLAIPGKANETISLKFNGEGLPSESTFTGGSNVALNCSRNYESSRRHVGIARRSSGLVLQP